MKINPKTFALCTLLFSSYSLFAQDVVKVGINEEVVSVSAPNVNQKVSVTIEDSAYDYRIDIMKVSKGYSFVNQPTMDSKKRKKDKKYSSRFFDEVGLGYMKILEQETYTPVQIGSSFFRPNTDPFTYQRTAFVPKTLNGGLYADVHIRNKVRSLGETGKVYFRNTLNLRGSYHSFNGDMQYQEYWSKGDGSQDSLLNTTSYKADIALYNIYLGKRYAFGYHFDRIDGLSLEYGLDAAIRIFKSENASLYDYNETSQGGNSITLESRNLFNPGITLMHRIGVNYKNFSLNYGYSLAMRTVGTDASFSGHLSTIGVSYRFR